MVPATPAVNSSIEGDATLPVPVSVTRNPADW
jgi:hypothetical protein